MSRARFEALLQPLLVFMGDLDPADPRAAERLEAHFPLVGGGLEAIAAAFDEGLADNWLCHRDGGPGVSYSRVRKALGPEDLSVDAVRMSGPGPGHTHPAGEFDLCFAAEGEPTFDGRPPGWTVYPPGSWHVPTVAGGTMNILYFLPGGAITFGPEGG